MRTRMTVQQQHRRPGTPVTYPKLSFTNVDPLQVKTIEHAPCLPGNLAPIRRPGGGPTSQLGMCPAWKRKAGQRASMDRLSGYDR